MYKKYVLLVLLVFLLAACFEQKVSVEKFKEPVCTDFQSDCQVILAAETFDVKFDQPRLVAEQEFSIYLAPKKHSNIHLVSGYMEGVNMFMGKIPLTFIAQSSSANSDQTINLLQATSMFGGCSVNKMTWRIRLTSITYSPGEQLTINAYTDITVLR